MPANSPEITGSTATTPSSLTLIPCSTLEDFPAHLPEPEACSLLAAWTAPWHPRLIAASSRLPQWHRADVIPDPLDNQLLLVPAPSQTRLPSLFAAETQKATNCTVLAGVTRADFLRGCERTGAFGPAGCLTDNTTLDTGERLISTQDFFALGYAWLQIQVMTRRLRYTSNLDEIYFAGRVLEAAQQWSAGNAQACAAALHDCYDLLAQERDHYFSNDPHLVDLTLLAPSTFGPNLHQAVQQTRQADHPPVNFLIDARLAPAITSGTDEGLVALRQAIDEDRVGIAGGGILSDLPIHHLSAAATQTAITEAKRRMDTAFGGRCRVYARDSGPTPGDLGSLIAAAGYRGAIPLDLSAGEGWATEPKLIWTQSPNALDVLACKPIDAAASSPFLALAYKLGQSIDSGEVATGLFVHWPNAESDAYRDLRAAASWGLALGRFWKIDDYFTEGQQPYHHYRGRATDGSRQWLESTVAEGRADALVGAATAYRTMVQTEVERSFNTLAAIALPSVAPESTTEAFCASLRALATDDERADALLVINPHSSPQRSAVRMDRHPEPQPAVFAASPGVDGRYDVTVDVPAMGFVMLTPAKQKPKRGWFFQRRKIASSYQLENEFMQIQLSERTGGIKGVYSGGGRGNRFAMRLVYVEDSKSALDDQHGMTIRSARVLRSDEAMGIIEVEGAIMSEKGKTLCDYLVRYSLAAGSRWIETETELKPASDVLLSDHAWDSNFAWRTALATESPMVFGVVRDKLHRVDGKRFDAPGGLWIDEVSRQTMFYADGRPAFRQRSDKYIDSLLLTKNQSPQPLRFLVGFDPPAPATAARALISPARCIPCNVSPETPTTGWLVHCSSADATLCDLQVESFSPLVITFQLVMTRNQSRSVKVRFCRDIVSAARQAGDAHNWAELKHETSKLEVSLAAHEVTRLRVELKG